MVKKPNKLKQLHQQLTKALTIDVVAFLLYLLFAGLGITWLKVTTSLIAILISLLCLYRLYMTRELLRRRSFWMTVLAVSVIVCTLFSLILNFP